MMKQLVRSLTAMWLALFLAFGATTPSLAQNAGQNPTTPAQTTVGTGATPPISLGMSKYNYSRAPKAFPNLIAPYNPISIPGPELTNSPHIGQLIHEGKLELSLQDTIELALENNLDIVVARYNVWFADTDLLRTAGGGVGRGTAGANLPFSQANIPGLLFDPQITGTYSIDSRVIPVNNPFTSGSGTGVTALSAHTTTLNTTYSQGFSPGTTFFTQWNNTRASSSSPAVLFNPDVQTNISVGIQQQLLNGFGTKINKRQIYIAKNNRKIADLAFAQQAITAVTNTITAYWELVYARENVNVQQQAVTVSEKLYNDNKKQLEIGTMAPLDVTRAESELATNRQNLIVAQTAQLQQQQALKNLIAKDPLNPALVKVEIVPTDHPTTPPGVEPASLEEAVAEAFQKRPDLREQVYNMENLNIETKAMRNALLPIATLTAQYGSTGLSGNSAIAGTPTTGPDLTAPIVDANGNLTNLFVQGTTIPIVGTDKKGFGDSMSQVFHNNFPNYTVALNVTVPIRNRVAQADYQRATLEQRQLQASIQALKNSAILDVNTYYVALVQDRARVEAASKARDLQQQTFDAENKKYQLGASTVYNVILTQRDLITARGTELRALADLAEAKANFERAMGRTLEVNNVNVADNGNGGTIEKDTLIPGTLDGKVVGTEKLFKKLDAESAASLAGNSSGQK